ncbi:DUF2306 domain-containing protein [Brevundimonas vesicularis]|uniref:DUF2306 domain-containing protein n=2 Tax=Brevundimonas vesicularis TaxID=41276 RepID=A0ABU4KTK8_BREVE|nr:DUF2306 domain-containing protein [Brevundimonas vesicularis]MDX2336336.1 DUF2306 domain-containing protein [Brevundimonas vesicularis]
MKAAGIFWFATAVAGQAMFVVYILGFYGAAAVARQPERWNDVLVGGYVAGGLIGNLVLAAHLLMAAIITIGGPLQLIPQLRARALQLHRWMGRTYIVTAILISLAGLYMVWTRGTAGGDAMRVGISINGVLILVAAVMAWRHAAARRIDRHRRWAMATFILVSGVWFFRVGLLAWIMINQGPVGIGDDFNGPFVRFWAYGCYLAPLAVLILYLRAQDRPSPLGKAATAAGLIVLTLVMGLGVVGATMGMWLPRLT